ncbi:MAG: endopeptidase La [Clostridia bacterium]|nr:endopeptidase La [Clostridia bacterium]MBP3648481.1 endopeptidase La [Clostridia bacterium]
MQETSRRTLRRMLPLLPLRGIMVFPHMVMHFDVGRPKSVAALEKAMMDDQLIFLVAQRDADVDDPKNSDLYRVGTVARIKQVLNLPGDSIRVLVEGLHRAVLLNVVESDPFMVAEVRNVTKTAAGIDPLEIKALVRTTHQYFEELAKVSKRVSQETLQSVLTVDEPEQLADIIAANVLTELPDRQSVLEKLKVSEQLETVCAIMLREIELTGVEKQVQSRIKTQIEQNQKDYYLREQIKAIQTELGDKDGTEVEELRERLSKTPLNEEARQKAQKEIDRLSQMPPGIPEINVTRTYIEWILDLPWEKTTKDQLDLKRARKVLDQDHYGMEQVKERIIEYLAVLRMKQDMKGPILCFAGPPGVGKTSIVRSIAKAVGREFVQMSLGGVRDEAEIRGHRRTYVAAIPGRIISGLKQAGTMNPVFLFDEIDKLSRDNHGDPSAALLEVLDGEQNHAFRDHYMELPFDLSRVMFITTANSVDTIPPALRDRLEIIEVSSYTEEEKLRIAKKHLLPKQITAHGLKAGSVRMSEKLVSTVIEDYTREAGVRQLERVLGKVVRKAAVEMLDKDTQQVTLSMDKLRAYLGAARYSREGLETIDRIGVVNGLAYTSVGGELLPVECTMMEGTGVLQLTGSLGDVMQESAKAALSWVRSHCTPWGVSAEFFRKHDIHIHVPEGAVPKDGPSAGVTLTTALVSALLSIPVHQNVAMTGEVTLRGRVLPIGGLKEKLMAAYRAGIKTVLIPKENMKDLEDVAQVVLDKLTIQPVDDVEQVLAVALTANLPVAEVQHGN